MKSHLVILALAIACGTAEARRTHSELGHNGAKQKYKRQQDARLTFDGEKPVPSSRRLKLSSTTSKCYFLEMYPAQADEICKQAMKKGIYRNKKCVGKLREFKRVSKFSSGCKRVGNRQKYRFSCEAKADCYSKK